MEYRLVLASNSPRRKELLAGLGIPFVTRVLQGIDESYPPDLRGEEIPLYISRAKAFAYRASMAPDELILTADTIVYLDGRVLGKPHSEQEAKDMLRALSGKTHQVITGVTLMSAQAERSFASVTHVRFAELTDEQIDYYVSNYRPFDKAGSYGIQEWIGYVGVESVSGSYFNVVGLPLQRLYTELRSFMEYYQ